MLLLTRRSFLIRSIALAAAGVHLPGFSAGDHYTVKKGDTLSAIARRHGVKLTTLKRVNKLSGDLILPGQKLLIPTVPGDLGAVKSFTNSINVRYSKWTYIVGHHSAIAYGNARVYDRNHRERGMQNGLAYHFVIGNGIDSGDGEIEIGPRWRKQLNGGHVRKANVNEHGIGICVVGNFEKTRPTRKQIAAFTSLVGYLGNDLLRGRYDFAVHKEVDLNHTVCPGRHFPTKAMHRKFN